ncbi:hypothetical protein CTRG_01237 [Candida tropicalis MYA-3404]|uniref:cyanamide hydratase n=1 Tax=Candida tropicalis (strain ATCC MYA-3404 / T1) TaxID=294747 RepID=C5M5V6_CANTT|nr:hypothetical protein CTRG_01237 [Candida tropicalis MYA-3404]EER34376.1 hypothetical protein CTRG_01237 [Candida tropicalis MYA-3404]KAG4408247.1 hypothetical protein JTP64_001553 [Candida tropicalis]
MSEYGFVRITRVVEEAIASPRDPTPQLNTQLPLDTPLAKFVYDYAKEKLPVETFNHSVRVYFYCVAIIKDQFPEWDLNYEVVWVTSLLHDIGTTHENMNTTKLSFETWGGILSRDLILSKTNGNKDYADAVCEAIVRHQDFGNVGYITTLGLILQIGTMLDNVGDHSHLIHIDTLDAVNKAFSRNNWLNCFADAIDYENKLKPWGHTTALGSDSTRTRILSNKLKYEKL